MTEFSQNLMTGDAGEEVLAAKQRLFQLGCYAPSIREIRKDSFGEDTRRAVKAFQRAKGLTPDGIIGESTWAQLFKNAEGIAARHEPSEAARRIVQLARERLGDLYVWGASGLDDVSDGEIQKGDDAAGAKRSIAFRTKQAGYGISGLLGHDCSGFVSFLLREAGLWNTRRDCDGLWRLCTKIERGDLAEGDLTFRVSAKDAEDETHVGLYCGRGLVIHAKGRDAGVVLEGIDQNGKGYWHKFGRLHLLYGEEV